jgi:hypothetical protein
VFDALDGGAGGSFRRASVSQRKELLDSWLHPGADPLEHPDVQRRLVTALAAQQIAAAPSEPEYGSTTYDLPLGPR